MEKHEWMIDLEMNGRAVALASIQPREIVVDDCDDDDDDDRKSQASAVQPKIRGLPTKSIRTFT